MDIEGGEIEALQGAAGVLREHCPLLAISVYHCQDHLWRIPLLIKSLQDRYHFFLRPHDEELWDLVCYAVPEQRMVRGKRNA
jgi:hypothetical protein